MATLTLSHGGFFDPDFGGTTYYVLGSGTSGNGTVSNPWLVDASDTVRFQQANSFGTGTCTGFAIFTNNNNIGISSTPIDKTVASGSLLNDGYNWQGQTYYIKRSASNDLVPDQFTFTDTTGAFTNVFYQSNTITISGMTPGVNVTATVTGVPSQSINGGAYFTNSSFTVQNGYTVRLRKKSSVNYSTTSNMTLTIGGISDTWSVTTRAAPDTTPDQFTFNDDLSGVPLSSTRTSNTITISGINSAANVSVTGGTFSKNGGAYTSTATTCNNGDTFAVRHTASGSYSTDTSTTLTVDTVSDTFTTRTEPVPNDGTPDPFTFSDQVGVARSDTTVTSNSITITDINLTVSVSVSGGTYSKNGGGYTSSAGTAVNGDTFTVRHTSSSQYSTQTNTTLTVGGVSDTFTSTTESLPVTSTYGVEVYTSAGAPNVAFTTGNNVATYFAGGTFTIPNGQSLSSSISVSGLTTSPLFHIFIVNASSGTLYGQENFGIITVSNGSFTFRRQDSQGNNFTAGSSDHFYTVVKTA
jgi:hypothetical protein